MRCGLVAVILSVAFAAVGSAGKGPSLPDELKAKLVTLEKGTPLADALVRIEKQTGIKVRNARGKRSAINIGQAFDQSPFWPTLDKIAAEVSASINLYGGDGVLQLVDRPQDPLTVSYHHAFRTTIKRITLTRDFDNGSHECVILLETAWEPRLFPFLMDVAPAVVTFAPDANKRSWSAKQPGKGQTQLDGRPHEYEVRVPAPERSSPMIQEMTGSVVLTVPTKMLDFTFPKLAVAKTDQEGVTVAVKNVTVQRDRWIVTVAITNPPDTPKFESYQTWLMHNRIRLGNGKQQWTPRPADEEQTWTARQAEVVYHFLLKDSPLPKSAPTDWALHYRTPGRMVEVEAPYRFEKVPLP